MASSCYEQSKISDVRAYCRGPWGEVPISSVFGFHYPLEYYCSRPENDSNFGTYRASRENSPFWSRESSPEPVELRRARERFREVENNIQVTRNRARSLSPFRSYSPFREASPAPPPGPNTRQLLSNIADSLRERNAPRTIIDPEVYRNQDNFFPPATPYTYCSPPRRATTPDPDMRTTSISYNSTSPWNSTGFYYSPRYPEAYRGTSSTYPPYTYSRRYYDYDIFNPYRIEYFKYPQPRKDYGYVPYKYSRKHMLTRSKI